MASTNPWVKRTTHPTNSCYFVPILQRVFHSRKKSHQPSTNYYNFKEIDQTTFDHILFYTCTMTIGLYVLCAFFSVELFAIPVLATLSFGLVLMAAIICFLMYNKCICTIIRKFHLCLGVVVLLTTAGKAVY